MHIKLTCLKPKKQITYDQHLFTNRFQSCFLRPNSITGIYQLYIFLRRLVDYFALTQTHL